MGIIILLSLLYGGCGFINKPAQNPEPDKKKLIEMIINQPELDMYLHPEIPGRIPLTIVKNKYIDSAYFMKKFNKPIRFVSLEEAKINSIRNYIEITQYKFISGTQILVEFIYPIEGLVCNIRMKYDKGWKIVEYEIIER